MTPEQKDGIATKAAKAVGAGIDYLNQPLSTDERERFEQQSLAQRLLQRPLDVTVGSIMKGGILDKSVKGFDTGDAAQIAGEDTPYGPALAPTGTLGESMRESREAVQQPTDLAVFADMIKRGQITGLGNKTTEDLQRILAASQDPNLSQQTRDTYTEDLTNLAKFYDQTKPIEPARSFTTSEGLFRPTPEAYEDTDLMDAQAKKFQGESMIFGAITGQFDNLGLSEEDTNLIEQTVLNRISTGSILDVIQQQFNTNILVDTPAFLGNAVFNWIPAALATGGEYGFRTIARAAGNVPVLGSLTGANKVRARSLSNIWAGTADYRKASRDSVEALLADTLGLRTFSKVFNDTIVSDLRETLKDEPERLDKILRVGLLNKAGDPIIRADGTQETGQRQLITEDIATRVMTGSIETLTEDEQFGVAAIDTLFIMAGASKAAKISDKKALEKAKEKLENYFKGNSDRKVHFEGQTLGEQLLTLQTLDKKFKFNKAAVTRALDLEAAEAGSVRMADEIANVSQDLDLRRSLDGTKLKEDVGTYKKGDIYRFDGDLTVPEMIAKRDSLKTQAFRSKIRMNGMPILRTTLTAGLPMSAAQYYSGEYLTDVFGGDRLAAQGIGSIVYLFGGKELLFAAGYGASRLNYAVKDPVGLAAVGLENLANIFPKLLKGDPDFFTGTISDGNITSYIKMLNADPARGGKKVSYNEMRSLKYLQKLSNSLDDESRGMVLDSIKEYVELQDRIVGFFPEEARAEAKRLFTETFATTSNLGWMRSASALATGTISASAVQSAQGMTDSMAAQNLQESSLDQGQRALNNFRALMKENVVDTEDASVIEDHITTLQAALNKGEYDLGLARENLDRDIEDTLDIALSDTTQEVDSGTINKFISLGFEVRKRIEPGLNEVAYRNKRRMAVDKALARRAQRIKGERFSDTGRLEKTARNLETTFLSFVDHAKNLARSPFTKLDERALEDGKRINVGKMIQDLFDMTKDPATGKDIGPDNFRSFFSAESEFFNGPMGGRVRQVFTAMAERSFADMSEETYRGLVDFHNLEFLPDGTRNVDFIEGGADALSIAMLNASKGNFKNFQALPGEVMDVYAAFRDFGATTGDKKLGRLYTEYSSSVLELVKKADLPYFNEWRKAADTYKIQWFDRFQRMEGQGTRLKKTARFGQLGPARTDDADKVDADEDVPMFLELFKYGYGSRVDPDTFFLPLVKKIKSAVKGGAEERAAAMSQIRRLAGEFADKDEQGNLFFDFADEASKARFDALQQGLQEFLYDAWARDVVKALDQTGKRSRRRAGESIKVAETGGYNMTPFNLENMQEVTDMFRIKVINDPDGDTSRSLVDLEAMISESRSIEKLIQDSEKYREEAISIIGQIQNEVKRQSKTIENAIVIEDAGTQALKEAASIRSSTQFVQRFIKDGDTRGLEVIKTQAKLRLTGGDLTKTKITIGTGDKAFEADVDEVIDKGIATLLTNGLLEEGGLDVIARTVSGADDKAASSAFEATSQFTKPERLFKLLSNEKSFENISAIIGEDHAGHLRDLAQYFTMKKGSIVGTKYDQRIDKLVREFGVNNLISRAFNVRRGMVSPQYVAAEIAVILASRAGIDMMKLAATDKEASRLIHRFLEFPDDMDKQELDRTAMYLRTFVITEMGSLGLDVSDFMDDLLESDDEELTSLIEQKKKELGEAGATLGADVKSVFETGENTDENVQ